MMMTTVRTSLVVAVGFTSSATTGCALLGPSAEAPFSISASSDDATSLHVKWDNGTITVRTDEHAQEITAIGKKVVRATGKSRAAAALEKLVTAIRPDDDDPSKLVLTMSLEPEHSGTIIGGDVEVVLPAAMALNVELGNGIVEIIEYDGDATVSLKRGSIMLDSRAGSVDVRCDTGEIEVTARPSKNDHLIAHVGIGAIDLHVPVGTAADLDLRSSFGAVDASLSDFNVTSRNVHLGSVKATINGGGAQIAADAGLGSVDFARERVARPAH